MRRGRSDARAKGDDIGPHNKDPDGPGTSTGRLRAVPFPAVFVLQNNMRSKPQRIAANEKIS